MRIEKKESVDGRRLISVTFERKSARADAPSIEVVYWVMLPEDIPIGQNQQPFGLTWLSSSLTDTRETAKLTREEQEAAFEAAVAYVAKLDIYNTRW